MALPKRRRSDTKKESPLTRQDSTKVPEQSILDSEEVAFPRGGASALSALELKEIANEATSDVLFANESSKKTTSSSARPQKKRKTTKTIDPEDLVDKDFIPIENSNFKNLVPGTLVFGKIIEVGKLELVLALADNLIGFVPITNISKQITRQLEDAEDSDESDNEDNDELDFPELSKYFKIGQWLRAIVVEPVNPSTGKNKKKRIDLSIEIEKVNQTLEETEDLVPNTTLQVTVSSVEDHGLILDIGKEGLTGFISNKEIKAAGKNIEDFAVGSVFFSTISSNKVRTVTVKLTTNRKNVTKTLASVDSVVPGNLVDALVTEIIDDGLITKVHGLVDGSINFSHLSVFKEDEIKHKFAIGSTVKARVLAVLLSGGAKKLYLSIQPHILDLKETAYDSETSSSPLDAFPVGHIIDSVTVEGHDSTYLYVKFAGDRLGQAHLSRVEGDNSALETTFSSGTNHPARVLGYSQIDDLYILTLDTTIIKQKYLRPQDIPIGELVEGEVLKISSEKGLVIKIFDKFEATVSPMHLSDVKLSYPERKFKVGGKVRGRVLNVSKFKADINVTLKKSLVNSENIISDFNSIKIGDRSSATVVLLTPSGAIVTFFGNVKAFLPKSEISETLVKKPEDYLKMGQTIAVRILKVDPKSERITVSCRLSQGSSESQQTSLDELIVGRSIIEGAIVEKSRDSVVVELSGSDLRGVILDGHLSDGSYEENRIIFKKLKVGSKIEALVLDKDYRNRNLTLTAKQSLIIAAKEDELPVSFDDIKLSDSSIPGYVKSVTHSGVFVGFGARLVGLVLSKYATDKPVHDLSSIFQINQSVSVKVLRIDEENGRFLLTLKEESNSAAINPVDKSVKKINDLTLGKITKVIVKSVKASHLNVQLADNIQGRIDASQIFDSFNDIKDPRNPLSTFHKGDQLDARVIGFYDSRNHTFSAATQKKSKNDIIELSARKSVLEPNSPKLLTIDELTVGEEHTGFINNSGNGYFFVTLSPNVTGIISFMDLSNNAELLSDVDEHFPIGTALKVRIQSIDEEKKSLVLTARENKITSFDEIKVDQRLPARVIHIYEDSVLVELGKNITAQSYITDALDDYNEKLSEVFTVNEIVPAVVLSVDEPNRRVKVSLRTENSKEKLIREVSDLKRGDIVKGFVKNITDKGLFVGLSSQITGYVRITDLSDTYLKDWKKFFKLHKLVTGKVSGVGNSSNNILLTLKESEVNGELHTLKTFNELEVGDVFEGNVRTVTDYGVFVKLDGTQNISGLCHRSQISDNTIHDLKALFGEGDRVKVKILSINEDKKQLSLGMKASYFVEDSEMKDVDDDSNEEYADAEEGENSEDELDEDAFDKSESENESEAESESESEEKSSSLSGLGTNGFDWTAQILDQVQEEESSDEEDFTAVKSKKKKSTKKIIEDTTGDIKSKAPQSVSDFERLIIGNPNSSVVWMNYMSFQLQLSEIDKAREIGERALKTISYREEQEKLNIWIALLNLENTFGTTETLEDVFKRSTEYMDSLTMHQKLVSIYILSENFEKADTLFKTITKKFGKTSVSVWVSYGDYLLDRDEHTKAHEILGSALNVLPKRDHVEIVRKFAQLEFKKGDAEQGRTLFEGLIADVPKRIDIWNVYIDQEIKKAEKKKAEELFERVLQRKISRKQAKFFFGKWLALEEKNEDNKGTEYVKAKAQQYVNGQ